MGAYTLLLRHPGVFGRAAAWDAPLTMEKPGRYGSGEMFGTAKNFARYRVTRLLRENAAGLRTEPRLVLLGDGNYRAAYALLAELEILHAYRDGPDRKHDWHSGWVREAAELLVGR